MTATLDLGAPTTFLPAVSSAAGLRGLLSAPYAQPGGPYPPEWGPYIEAAIADKRGLWGGPLMFIPPADRHALEVVRAASGEWSAPRTDAGGSGPAPLAALFRPVPKLGDVPLDGLPLGQLHPLTADEHRAALGGHTPRSHPRACGYPMDRATAINVNWPATEFAPDLYHHTPRCAACTMKGDRQRPPMYPRTGDPATDPALNQSWTPLAEWGNRDGWDRVARDRAAQLDKGTPGFRVWEDIARKWARGRDALEPLACEYVNALRDESQTAWDQWKPPAPAQSPKPPSRSVLWH